ncbi:MAG TPA: rhomboid family intramembrane serine protease [Gemmatimonadaceae bacterium]|nr:rhomboid family intramembrane serine protease [Gemmatimonadaceae bacterium]
MAAPQSSLTRRATSAVTTQVKVLGGSLGVMWATLGANALASGALLSYGVVPRTRDGLWGILSAPFIHANVQHLAANSVPFLILGALVLLRGARRFLLVTILATLGSGIAAWAFGAPGSVHVGASGVIFGYLGFLMLAGWFARSWGSIALSVLVTVAWGGLVFGVMPGTPGVSWQSHLGGFLGGVLAARWFARA